MLDFTNMNQRNLLIAGILVVVLILGAAGLLLMNRADNTNAQPEIDEQTEQTDVSEEEELTEDTDEDMEDADQGEATVTLSSSGFSPRTVTIKAGDKLTWVNESGKEATVDSNPHPVHTSYPKMNLGSFSDGETFEFTFPEAGTYNYHNHFNASQGGSVIVE